ncbi:MAG TPA: RNA-binding protein [Vicinamibacteria bacterium]|nr:RNA-binding protein [Vicinamibacteria bacterium]
MPQSRLFVGNIPYTATEEDLRGLFEGAGKVASIRIITDFDTGRSKGYAFVEMASPADAEQAVKNLNGTTLSERKIVVNEARPRASGGPSGGHRRRP